MNPPASSQIPSWLADMGYSGAFAMLFLLIHVSCAMMRPRPKWNRFDTALVVWAFIYAATAVFYSYPGMLIAEGLGLGDSPGRLLKFSSLIGIPSVVTALLAHRAWRSKVVRKSVLLGMGCAIVASLAGSVGLVLAAPLAWNLLYLAGCVRCLRDAKSQAPSHGVV